MYQPNWGYKAQNQKPDKIDTEKEKGNGKGIGVDLDRDRLYLNFALVGLGIVAVIIFVLNFGADHQVVVTGIGAVGTLVGFLVGHTAGSVGKEKSEQRTDRFLELIRKPDDTMKGKQNTGEK
jgi:hypothetical protein